MGNKNKTCESQQGRQAIANSRTNQKVFGYRNNTPIPLIAQQLYRKGYEPIPIAPNRKYPTMKGWPTVELPIAQWPENHGIGLRTGRVTGIDIDVYDKNLVDLLVEELRTVYPALLTRVGQPPKTLLPCFVPELSEKTISPKFIDENGVINQVELLSYGQQFVAYGIHPDTNLPYQWDGDLTTVDLPTIPLSFIHEIFITFQMECEKRGWSEVKLKGSDEKKIKRSPMTKNGSEPSTIYNRVMPIEDVLSHYGWTNVHSNHWARPGKKRGVSGNVKNGYFMCFTTSTILKGAVDGVHPSVHDAFDVMAIYSFGGNKSKAASAVLREAR